MQNAYLHGNQCNSLCMETMLLAIKTKGSGYTEIPYIDFPQLMEFHWNERIHTISALDGRFDSSKHKHTNT